MSETYGTTLEDVLKSLIDRSQNDLDYAAQPAIATLLLTKEGNFPDDDDKVGLIDYFREHFISDYNRFERNVEYKLIQEEFNKYLLTREGEQHGKWMLDLEKPFDKMVTEIALFPTNDDIVDQSIMWLLNNLNKQYYSATKSGLAGEKEISSRITIS